MHALGHCKPTTPTPPPHPRTPTTAASAVPFENWCRSETLHIYGSRQQKPQRQAIQAGAAAFQLPSNRGTELPAMVYLRYTRQAKKRICGVRMLSNRSLGPNLSRHPSFQPNLEIWVSRKTARILLTRATHSGVTLSFLHPPPLSRAISSKP